MKSIAEMLSKKKKMGTANNAEQDANDNDEESNEEELTNAIKEEDKKDR